MHKKLVTRTGMALTAAIALAACDREDKNNETSGIEFKNHSSTPALVKKLSGFDNLTVYTLVGSDDVLEQSPNFVFGGSADGAGLLKNGDGTYSLLTNHEDNFSVSRLTLDKNLKPVKGEYILNSTGGIWRLCSASMATQEEHGFGPTFLTCGESSVESRIHAINPFLSPSNPSISKEVAGLGRWNSENALPLSKDAYAGKTVVLIGDDDSGPEGGQVILYVSNTIGDLNSGKLYVMKRSDNNIKERDIVTGNQYDVEFAEIPNAATMTGAQLNLAAVAASSIQFGRVEDLDYRKGSAAGAREIYFNTTGQATSGANAAYTRAKYGRVYRLVMNANDPTKGKIECILDGEDRSGVAKDFQNPDNILVTQNFVYIQEDPNGGYNDQTHDAYVYQYNIATKELRKVVELDHRRAEADAAKFNAIPGSGYPQPVAGKSGYGSWEYGAMLDISDIVGEPNTFLLNIQPHTWVGDKYKNPDGGTIRVSENQASQVVIIRGLPR
ncbi:MAG TPA: hypothetical protein VER36_02075 [Flavisolibacter sp.]|nr:hypothetical protein [Flavisolibacter sp.]